jgi:adenosyl cobinamide kinase/adenosyl cobinamide phosphate guanylyltransferase
MNLLINHEINTLFVSSGCTLTEPCNEAADYYHAGTDIYLRYSPDLPDERIYSRTADRKEIVIVVACRDDLRIALRLEKKNEVVLLEDLGHFLTYRAFSENCFDYRMKKQRWASAFAALQDTYHITSGAVCAADAAFGAGMKMCREAGEALEATMPPSYYQNAQ